MTTTPDRSRRRDVGGFVALAICLAVVAALSWVSARVNTGSERRETAYGMGQPVERVDDRVSVDEVILVDAVRGFSSEPARPLGIFVVVRTTTTATTTEAFTPKVRLRTTAGVEYRSHSDLSSVGSAAPGYATTVLSVFDLPRDAVPGARVVIEPRPQVLVAVQDFPVVDPGLTDRTPVEAEIRITEPDSRVVR